MTIILPQATPDHGEAGFTLIEVLIALAILGLSLSVLLGAFVTALARVQEARERLEAVNLANTIILQAETMPAQTIRNLDGSTKTGFQWHLRVSDYASVEDRTHWTEQPVQIRVQVSWNSSAHTRSIDLISIRLLPKEPAS